MKQSKKGTGGILEIMHNLSAERRSHTKERRMNGKNKNRKKNKQNKKRKYKKRRLKTAREKLPY